MHTEDKGGDRKEIPVVDRKLVRIRKKWVGSEQSYRTEVRTGRKRMGS